MAPSPVTALKTLHTLRQLKEQAQISSQVQMNAWNLRYIKPSLPETTAKLHVWHIYHIWNICCSHVNSAYRGTKLLFHFKFENTHPHFP